MIIYNVTIKVDNSIHQDWFKWMLSTHIPEVMNTGMFQSHRFCKLLDQDESDGVTYAIQYFAENIEKIFTYQEKYAPSLQKAHTDRYKSQFVVFRTLLKVIE
jgi:hypothetical protein